MPKIIAADIGTTHCKVLVVDEKGRVIYSAKADVVSYQPEEGWYEQDAEQIFQTLFAMLRETFAITGADDIACVSFSAAMHSVLAIDANDDPLTPAITWADTRSKIYAKQLRESETGRSIYAQTGTPIHAMSPFCKLLWLRQEQPHIFKQAHKFISIKEYIFSRLFGKFIVDEGIASSSGLYDIYNRTWCRDALQMAGISKRSLSEVVKATHAENLLPFMKAELRLEKNIPFIAGGTDGCLANLGCGALQPDVAVITTGTSAAVRSTIIKPQRRDLSGLFRYVLSDDIYITGGGLNNGGNVLKWFAGNFIGAGGENIIDETLRLAATVPAGSSNLLFLPYLAGERAPVWDESAAGVFFGIKMHHHKAHFARAVVEGLSFSLVQVLFALEETYKPVERIYASGAITQSKWWMQMLADMSGKPVYYQDAADASALGAAIMGMYATGIIGDLQQASQFFTCASVFNPDQQVHELYMHQYKTYTVLYPSLKDCF